MPARREGKETHRDSYSGIERGTFLSPVVAVFKLYRPAIVWASVAFGVRVATAIALHIYSVEAGYQGFVPLESGADDRYYFETGAALAAGADVDVTMLPNIYPYLLAALFRVTGPDLMAAKLLNVMISALGVYFGVLAARIVARTSRLTHYEERKVANISGALLAFYPASVFYSGQLVKDTIIQALSLCLLVALLHMFTSRRHARLASALVAIVGLVLLFWLRGYLAVALLAASGIYVIASRSRPGWKLGVLLGIVVLPYVVGFGPLSLSALSRWLDPEWLADWRANVYGIGRSSLGIWLTPGDPVGFLMGWAYSFISILLGPLPWQVSSSTVAIGLLDSFAAWVTMAVLLGQLPPFGSRLLKLKLQPGDLVFLFALILAGGIALFSDNLGANIRLRLPVLSALYVYVSPMLRGIIQVPRLRSRSSPADGVHIGQAKRSRYS